MARTSTAHDLIRFEWRTRDRTNDSSSSARCYSTIDKQARNVLCLRTAFISFVSIFRVQFKSFEDDDDIWAAIAFLGRTNITGV